VTARALWTCPECRERLTADADEQTVARDALVQVVREHLDVTHGGADGLANAAAQAGGWLSAAGHLVELWGGPHDGARVWSPPGPLPPVIGVKVAGDGKLVPLRGAGCRTWTGVDTYVLGMDGLGTTAADRYVWTP